jgi:hypothetical protein
MSHKEYEDSVSPHNLCTAGHESYSSAQLSPMPLGAQNRKTHAVAYHEQQAAKRNNGLFPVKGQEDSEIRAARFSNFPQNPKQLGLPGPPLLPRNPAFQPGHVTFTSRRDRPPFDDEYHPGQPRSLPAEAYKTEKDAIRRLPPNAPGKIPNLLIDSKRPPLNDSQSEPIEEPEPESAEESSSD